MNNNVAIMYHNDRGDGELAASIVKLHHPKANLIPMSYDKDIPWYKLQPKQTIYVVDLSFDMYFLNKLNDEYNLIWIDHHDSVIKEAEFNNFNPKGIRDTNYAACLLTWKYFNPDTAIPRVIELIDDYDRWIFQYEDTLKFNRGIRSINNSNIQDNIKLWQTLITDLEELQKYINIGDEINKYLSFIHNLYSQDLCFETDIDGYNVLCANIRGFSSLFFEHMVDKEKHAAVCLYSYIGNVGVYRYSIYAVDTSINVSEIAKKMGGGGHSNAAGWSSKELTLKQEPEEPSSEFSYDNIFKTIKDYLNENNKVHAKRYAANGDKVILNSQWFISEFENRPCSILNHICMERYIFNPIIDDYDPKPLITFIWTNLGYYRIIIHNSDLVNGLDLHKLAEKYDGKVIDRIEQQPCAGSLWFYTKELPFKLCKRVRADDIQF